MYDRGGLFVIPDRVQKHSNRCLSYRGHDRSTCAAVSTVSWHVGHLSVFELCRLKRDWLRRERLKRNRAMVEASDGGRVVKYLGRDFSGRDW
jgi:hypothetical protein